MSAFQIVAIAVLVTAHLASGHLRSAERSPRSRWLSAAGGVAIAYVFVHLLPQLAEADRTLSDTGPLASLERHAYLVALVGLAVFYGLEHVAAASRDRRGDGDRAGPSILAIHVAAFGAYNALIGYLVVHRVDGRAGELALFTAAMLVHFVVVDTSLRRHHRDTYDRVVRWVLAGALVAGFLLGAATEVSEALVALLIAFLAGAVVFETLKEEVPSDRRARFAPFAAGAAVYAAVLLLV